MSKLKPNDNHNFPQTQNRKQGLSGERKKGKYVIIVFINTRFKSRTEEEVKNLLMRVQRMEALV